MFQNECSYPENILRGCNKRHKLFEVVGDKSVIRTVSYPVSHMLMLEMVQYSIKLKVLTIMIKREKNDKSLSHLQDATQYEYG